MLSAWCGDVAPGFREPCWRSCNCAGGAAYQELAAHLLPIALMCFSCAEAVSRQCSPCCAVMTAWADLAVQRCSSELSHELLPAGDWRCGVAQRQLEVQEE